MAWVVGLGLAACAIIGVVVVMSAPRAVEIVTASRGAAVDVVYASGVIEYVRQAHVAPVVTAPIRTVEAEEGQFVRAGQILARLDDGPQQGTALQLRAQAVQAAAAANRQARLRAAGFGALAAAEDAEAQARAAAAAASSAQALLDDYKIRSPMTGRVLRREAELGDLARAGDMLFLVADPARIRVTADVDERDVARLSEGQSALIRADGFPGRTFEGRIDRITPAGDATGRVFRVRVGLPAPTLLRPGMTVELNLVTARRDQAILVPSTAVREGVVWLDEDGRARRRPVKIGAASGDQAEILAGVPLGARVIVSPPKSLREGERVRDARP